jgi:hypothetical protein
MDALPNTTGSAPTLPALPPNLTRRQENYARCVASGLSYAEAFRQAGGVASTAASASSQIQILNRTPHVRARIIELRGKADEETVDNLKERMAWLRLIISADPAELSRIVTKPCGECWPDPMIAERYAAHFAPCPLLEERPALPDVQRPRHDCTGCEGAGIQRVVLTPTDELSPAGRALFMGASQDADGIIEIKTRDQGAAADMLNKLNSAYVQRSLNMNINASVQAARDVTAGDAARLFEAFGK